MDLSSWISYARANGFHPYVISFLSLNPSMWREAEAKDWQAVGPFLSSMDDKEVGLDSEQVVQPLLLDLLGPTNSALFWGFCQQQLEDVTVSKIFQGQFFGALSYEQADLLPIVDGVMFVFHRVISELQDSEKPVESWVQMLGVEGRSAVINLFKWLVSVTQDNREIVAQIFQWGGPRFWETVESMMSSPLLVVSNKALSQLRARLSSDSEKESG